MKRIPLTPVRLTEIPLNQRMRAARILCREAADSDERISLLAAALSPSDKVYFVPVAELAA